MPQNQDIDAILRDWPYQPGVIQGGIVRTTGRRKVLQMRIELGLLQMEFTGRPDGERPGDKPTYLEHISEQLGGGDDVPQLLTDEQCFEIDREFVQYYHRRICCLALREFDRAVADADHTLELMDFVAAYSPNEEWTASHERVSPLRLLPSHAGPGLGGAGEVRPGGGDRGNQQGPRGDAATLRQRRSRGPVRRDELVNNSAN